MEAGSGRSGARAAVLALALLPLLALLAAPPGAAAARRPRKSAQDCNDELREKASAITAAGMSASAFFHSCWWDTEPGVPTPITADERAKRPFEARSSQARSSETRPAARRSAARQPAARPPAERGPTRSAERRRLPPRRDEGDEPLAVDEAVAPAAAAAPVPPYPPPAGLPGRVTVGVPALGQLSLPILPGLAPAVRTVVDHSPVPGLVTTGP